MALTGVRFSKEIAMVEGFGGGFARVLTDSVWQWFGFGWNWG